MWWQVPNLFAQGFAGEGWVAVGREGCVEDAHDELVALAGLAIGDGPLEIPGGATGTTSRGGLGEADLVFGTEDLGESHAAAEAEVPRLGITMGREAEGKFEGEGLDVLEVAMVIEGAVGGIDSVAGCNAPDPVRWT